MTTKRHNRNLTVRTAVSEMPMPIGDWQAAESLLARLVAHAFAADRPELFGAQLNDDNGFENSGASSSARTDAVAPAAMDDAPDTNWSVEQQHGAKGN